MYYGHQYIFDMSHSSLLGGAQFGIQFLAFWCLKRGQETYMALNIPKENVKDDDEDATNTKNSSRKKRVIGV